VGNLPEPKYGVYGKASGSPGSERFGGYFYVDNTAFAKVGGYIESSGTAYAIIGSTVKSTIVDSPNGSKKDNVLH